ncbi:MAG TPA: ABC transporter ATP-binding protein [Longimicrobiales bacterium]|nr:ABC transporter ATP-binding protein [Longimicrobiales bacterium]
MRVDGPEGPPRAVGPAVSLRGLVRSFGPLRAVDGLTFDVGAGELFGLVGPDGAGKTTTLRVLAGVLRPTSGDASVLGTSVAADPEGMKLRIAYMPQRFGLYEELSVRENLDFYADLFGVSDGERPDRYERLFRFSGLAPFQDRKAGALSGGMKQKLALSCALVHRPRLLLLDEPTFGVDPISRRELWRILEEMVGGGTTAILSTSYMDEAERCDRVALLHRGRLLALDDPDALRDGLPGALLELRADEPRRARDLLRSFGEVRDATLFGDVLHVLLAHEEATGTVADRLAGEGVEILERRRVRPSLEDVFLQRVRDAEGVGTASGGGDGADRGDASGPGSGW